MRGGGRLFMLAGAGLGLVAVALLAMAFVGGRAEPVAEPQAAQSVPVTLVKAMRDVPPRTILTSQDVYEESVPAEDVPEDAVRSTADVVGMAYRGPLVKDQRLVTGQLEQPGLANEIAPGKRAMALPAGTGNLLSGLVQDGNFVDVIFKARINEVRLLGHVMGPTPEDETSYEFGNDEGFGWIPSDILDEYPGYPAPGDPGSQLLIRDGVGDEQQLEPVAKVMLQDIRVLRVVRPGEKFGADGQSLAPPAVEGAAAPNEELPGFLVVEVTDQQAELLAFMIDEKHVYNVVVRGTGDHQTVGTTGVTFEILATNDAYGLPVPGSITVASGSPLPGDLVAPEALEEGDYRSGERVVLPEREAGATAAIGAEPGR